MAYSVTSTWRSISGKEAEMKEVLKELRAAVRTEPGCSFHEVQQSLTDPQVFMIYAIFKNRAAFDAHLETEHVQLIARTRAMALRDSSRQSPASYETIE
jgi:(4S)-4-hydroxy-5-phosphonooxypentane-2,3-dione isomerase